MTYEHAEARCPHCPAVAHGRSITKVRRAILEHIAEAHPGATTNGIQTVRVTG